MSQNDEQKKAKKDAMKRLRQKRKQKIKEIAATMKAQKKAVKAIKEQMKNDVGTVPSIARETGISPDQVLWYIAALKKYGEVSEAEKDGGYFRYVLTARPPEEISNGQPDGSQDTA
jgi:predicted Rossmann fold nucleotide-binding protein DprA/Smf involved in DNA uptake